MNILQRSTVMVVPQRWDVTYGAWMTSGECVEYAAAQDLTP
jgi:hypothetical protein